MTLSAAKHGQSKAWSESQVFFVVMIRHNLHHVRHVSSSLSLNLSDAVTAACQDPLQQPLQLEE